MIRSTSRSAVQGAPAGVRSFLLCALLLVTGCDGFTDDLTWAPHAAEDSAAVVDEPVAHKPDAVADDRSDAPDAEIPSRPQTVAPMPVDAVAALVSASGELTWTDQAWPSTASSDGEEPAQEERVLTDEESAALVDEAAAVLDERPQIPGDLDATSTDQDAMVENLTDEQLAAYEDPSLADDNQVQGEVSAEPSEAPATQFSLDLVIDETRSIQGRDFYNIFYRNWEAPEGAMNYTVYVREQPGRGQGSVVEVRVNDEIAFRTQLQPRYEVVEEAAHQAVQFTQRFMQRGDVSRRIY